MFALPAAGPARHAFPARRIALLVLAGAYAAACAPAARAQGAERLAALINAYRVSAPTDCMGRPPQRLAPLTIEPALARVRIGRGTILEPALDKAGYAADLAEAISLVGARDEHAAMEAIEHRYCITLLNPQFSAMGVARTADGWQIVLARPMRMLKLAGWREEGRAVLQAVNAVRAKGHTCGEQRFPAAPALAWNEALGNAALAHSRDMVRMKTLTHQGKNGSMVAERAELAGYRWQTIAENIASGFATPAEAVDNWLGSPGHCANIMNANFRDMGAAYDINSARRPGTVYWTQVFGVPK